MSAGEFVVHQEAEKDGDVQYGSVHEPFGALVGLGAGRPKTDLNKSHRGNERAEEVEHASKAHDRRKQTDSDKRGRVENDLAEGTRALFVDHGQHEDAGAGVIFAIHPGNGVEVRELPEKKDREEQPGSGVKLARRRGPANHWGNCPWDRADEGGPDGALLEWSVR